MNDLQEKILEAFVFLDKICDENNLRYYASGGTLLGAVRHKGFIPWDDDLDVWMPRQDYEKLIDIMGREKHGKYVLETPRNNFGKHYYPYGKLYDTTTSLVERTKFRAKKGVFVDIFPIDGLGNNEQELDKIYKKLRFKNLFIASRICVPRPARSILKNLAIYVSRIIPECVLDTEKLLYKFDRECAKIEYDNSKFVGVLMGSYGKKDIVPKKWLDDISVYEFEGKRMIGPKDYDQMLSFIYGDWKKLPPLDKQVSPHDFDDLDLEHGYLD